MQDVGTRLNIKVFDKNKKLVNRFEKQSDSFVIGFVRAFYFALMYDTSITTGERFPWRYRSLAPDGDASYGVVVGNGSQNMLLTDTSLDNQLLTDNLTYSSVGIDFPVVIGNSADIVHWRAFSNISGEDLYITEAGIIRDAHGSTATIRRLIVKDTFAPILLQEEHQLLVEYILTFRVHV